VGKRALGFKLNERSRRPLAHPTCYMLTFYKKKWIDGEQIVGSMPL